jgi:hypothetical protein
MWALLGSASHHTEGGVFCGASDKFIGAEHLVSCGGITDDQDARAPGLQNSRKSLKHLAKFFRPLCGRFWRCHPLVRAARTHLPSKKCPPVEAEPAQANRVVLEVVVRRRVGRRGDEQVHFAFANLGKPAGIFFIREEPRGLTAHGFVRKERPEGRGATGKFLCFCKKKASGEVRWESLLGACVRAVAAALRELHEHGGEDQE